MATKLERTVVLPESIYKKIVRLADEERSNIPFVTRQLLVKGLADESKSRPDWFYELQSQIVGLRNEVLEEQRARRQEVTAGELLAELQEQIASREKEKLEKPEKPVKPGFDVIELITGLPWSVRSKSVTLPRDESNEEDHSLDWVWGLGAGDDLARGFEEEVEAKPEPEQEDYSHMLWGPMESEAVKEVAAVEAVDRGQDLEPEMLAVQKQVAELKEAVFGRQEDATKLVPGMAIELQSAEEEASDKPRARGNILRPFFGRLSKIFGVVLS